MHKKFISIGSVIIIAFFAAKVLHIEQVHGQSKPTPLSIGTTGSGGGAYLTGSSMARVLNTLQDVFELSPLVTAGFGENPILVHIGDASMGMVMEAHLEDAYFGRGDFRQAHSNIRRLFTYNIFIAHFIVRKDAGIKNLHDLAGKRINLGVPAQITRDFNDILMKALDVDIRKDIRMFELSTGDGFNALRDGIIHAASNLTVLRQGSLIELATAIDIEFLDYPKDIFNKFNELAGGVILPAVVPANTYPRQEKDNITWAAGSTIIANKDVSDDIIYKFTKTFWENLKALGEADSSFLALNVNDHALSKTNVPMHPGAKRYFKEIGLLN